MGLEILPDHVAVIQDGNRRYADQRGEDPLEGHVYGADTTEEFLDWLCDLDVPEATLYTFSTENFRRSERELRSLFDLIARKLHDLAEEERVHSNRVRIRGVGELGLLPRRVRRAVERVERVTRDYGEMRLNVALAYGGRQEMLDAAREVLRRVEQGAISADEVTEAEVSRHTYVGDVDLVIRTGGERRISNFLPWQAAGGRAVVEFRDEYWPEFRRSDLHECLERYAEEVQGGPKRPVVELEGSAD